MKKLSLSLVFAIALFIANAQPQIEFESTTYDFGTVPEAGGKVTGRFVFKNTGNEDLILQKVQPGCGCTAANYTKEAVKPGEKGFIDAAYDPYNRPNAFNKNIKVVTNANPETPMYIYIKGNVTPREKTKQEKLGYTNGVGNLRIKNISPRIQAYSTGFSFDTVLVYNFDTIKPFQIRLDTSNISFTEQSRSFGAALQPDKEGFIVLKYNPSKKQQWGNFTERVTFLTNDSVELQKRMFYSIEVKEDFSKLTPKELENAPVMVLSDTIYDFQTVAPNTEISHDFTIENKGKSKLIIRQITPNQSVSYTLDKWELKAGEKATLNFRLQAPNRATAVKITADIISNDPKNPKRLIVLTGTVK